MSNDQSNPGHVDPADVERAAGVLARAYKLSSKRVLDVVKNAAEQAKRSHAHGRKGGRPRIPDGSRVSAIIDFSEGETIAEKLGPVAKHAAANKNPKLKGSVLKTETKIEEKRLRNHLAAENKRILKSLEVLASEAPPPDPWEK